MDACRLAQLDLAETHRPWFWNVTGKPCRSFPHTRRSRTAADHVPVRGEFPMARNVSPSEKTSIRIGKSSSHLCGAALRQTTERTVRGSANTNSTLLVLVGHRKLGLRLWLAVRELGQLLGLIVPRSVAPVRRSPWGSGNAMTAMSRRTPPWPVEVQGMRRRPPVLDVLRRHVSSFIDVSAVIQGPPLCEKPSQL